MESMKMGNRGPRVALVVALIVASVTLTGCSSTASASHRPANAAGTPSPRQSASSYTTEDASGGFIYNDAPSGYAITFPQRPDVQPLSNNESDQSANYVSAELTSGEFVSIGQVLNKTPNLQSQLMGVVQSFNPTGQVSASGYTLGGLDAAQAEFTTGDGGAIPTELVGQPGQIVVAGDGNRFYELLAIGGSSDQRQAFFDSFKRIDK